MRKKTKAWRIPHPLRGLVGLAPGGGWRSRVLLTVAVRPRMLPLPHVPVLVLVLLLLVLDVLTSPKSRQRLPPKPPRQSPWWVREQQQA